MTTTSAAKTRATYFTLADEDATIECCVWRSRAVRIRQWPSTAAVPWPHVEQGQAGPGADHEAGAALSPRRARFGNRAQRRGCRRSCVEVGGPAALDLGR